LTKEFRTLNCKVCEKRKKFQLLTRRYRNNHDDGYTNDIYMEMWKCSIGHILEIKGKLDGSSLANHPVWDIDRDVDAYRVYPTNEDYDACNG